MCNGRRISAGVIWAVALGTLWLFTHPIFAGNEPTKTARTPLGIWHWFNGKTVEFKANGQTEASDGMKGRWTGGNAVQNVTVKWEGGATDTLGFSPDNARLYNANTNVDDTMGERSVPLASPPDAVAATPLPKPSVGGAGVKAPASPVQVVRADPPPIGQWHWFNDQTVTFKRTGEVEASGGWRGKWYVSPTGNREVAILWDGQPPDVITISPDGKKLAGGVVSAERLEEDAAHPASTPPPLGTTKGGGYFGTRQPGQ